MVYHRNGGAQGASFSVPRAVQARSLLKARLSKRERAIIGADVIDGRVPLQGLTVKLVAMAVGCSAASILRALRLTPAQREEVRRGRRPLVRQQSRALPVSEIDWSELDDAALSDIVRRIGIDRTRTTSSPRTGSTPRTMTDLCGPGLGSCS
jgi:hypothetical protein